MGKEREGSMKIAGIIAEYNPFHTGHVHHIRETRKLSGCDYIVVCMSGCFTQRGEPACLPVRDRARAALENGADAVILLPALWAVRSADAFARGGVSILSGVGCDLLSFGSEYSDIDRLRQLARVRAEEPEAVSRAVRAALGRGESHARARGSAIAEVLGIDPALTNAPNTALAVEYIRAAEEIGSDMEFLPIPRAGGYHDHSAGAFASAEAIRAALSAGDRSFLRYTPDNEALALTQTPARPMDDMLLYRLRTMTAGDYERLPDMAEGLENRVQRAAGECADRESLIAAIKCKRYTYARISRACAHALLGIDREIIARNPMPGAALLIGARADARPLLSELKTRSKMPILSSAARIKDNETFETERRAWDIHALLCGADQRAGRLFTEKFLMV